jgi:hypothetical protein
MTLSDSNEVEVTGSNPAQGSCSTDLYLLLQANALPPSTVLLSQQELDFLAEKGKYSKKIEQDLRYKILEKVEAFKAVELPLLIDARLLNGDVHIWIRMRIRSWFGVSLGYLGLSLSIKSNTSTELESSESG